MELPLILVNLKCYSQGTGRNALKLAKICRDVAKKYKVTIAVSPQFTDICKILNKVRIPIFAQHIDSVGTGAHTGHVTAFAVKQAGAVGTLINHSERKLTRREIEKCVDMARKNDLISVACSDTLMKSRDIVIMRPDFIAYEPPELIGTGVSVSKTKPRVVGDIVKMIKRINPRIKVLCGAGITNGEDVRRALDLGTEGVLVASGVVKADNPRKVLIEFAEATKS